MQNLSIEEVLKLLKSRQITIYYRLILFVEVPCRNQEGERK